MRKQSRKVPAWWVSPVLGIVILLVSEAVVWSYPHVTPFGPSLRQGGGDVFIHESGPTRLFSDEGPFVIGRRSDREREVERWESLPPEERLEMRRRMDRWKGLSPQDQQLLRKRYRQWQELAPDERQRMRRNLREWDALSPQEQEQIRKRFQRP
jgi:hypothetical protein